MNVQRYARQLSLPGFGPQGQQRLQEGKILVIGAGGLGSSVIFYLAAAGVGHITIADGDRVSLSNLQRQIIHTTNGIGELKVLSARQRALALNPQCDIEVIPEFLSPESLREIAVNYDFVIDATDSLEGKFFINDICARLNVPCCYGAIQGYQGQLMTTLPGHASLGDLFDEPPALISEPVGPLGVVAGIIGTLQAAEAIKFLAQIGELLTDTLLTYNSLTCSFRKIKVGNKAN